MDKRYLRGHGSSGLIVHKFRDVSTCQRGKVFQEWSSKIQFRELPFRIFTTLGITNIGGLRIGDQEFQQLN